MHCRWFLILGLLSLSAVGCHGGSGRGSHRHDPVCPADAACPDCQGVAADGCATPCDGKAEEIHVRVPRQKVVVPRHDVAPDGRVAAAGRQQLEQQQVVQTRQVMLVPQQVLVPFVQTTVSGPVRVNGLSETQVTNLAAVTTTGVAAGGGVAVTGQTNFAANAAGGFVGTPNVPGGSPNAPGGPQTAPGGNPNSPQTVSECLVQLEQSREQVRQLMDKAVVLEAEVRRLRGGVNPAVPPLAVPPPPAPVPPTPVPPPPAAADLTPPPAVPTAPAGDK